MTKQELAAKMEDAHAWVPGRTVKIDFGNEGAIMLDGNADQVTDLAPGKGGAAETTIKVGWDDWQKIADGELDPMTAFMMGKIKVEGDMTAAMQLQGVLGKLRG